MAKKYFTASAGDLTSAASNTGVDVGHCEEISFLVGGTFVGTYDVEVSLDGTNWIVHPSYTGLTAGAAGEIALPCKKVRMTCTAFTSGTLVCHVSGRNYD